MPLCTSCHGRPVLGIAFLATLFLFTEEMAFPQQTANFFLPAPRAMRQHLNRAENAIEQERFGDAVLELGALLTQDLTGVEGAEPQDYFIVDSSSDGASTSLKSEAQRLLGSLPPGGRELYELQFGADARALLAVAVAESDFEKLNEVVRKYSHTRAGNEALVLLGRLHLDRGQPLAAALCFQRVLDSPAAAASYDPELSVLLAACWKYADRPEKAVATLESLRQRYPRTQLQIGDETTVQLPLAPDALSWLDTHFGNSGGISAGRATEWRIHRGNPARNADSSGGMPLATFRWRARTATDPTDEELIGEIQAGYRSQNIPALPSLQPLVVGKVVLMRTAERLLAINFDTGKRIWEYPWWDASYPTVTVGSRGGTRPQEIELRKQQLIQRLWQDAPYGQLASDGESVYVLDELRFAQAGGGEMQWFQRGRNRGRGTRGWTESHNQLVALDLHRQGSMKWMVGGETGMNEPRLAGAFFLGPPLPLMGQLYVLAEINGEIRLLVLDPETGRQEWSQQLAHVDTYTILKNSQRRLSGATPSFADGVLVCPTSAGAVVAVDLATRALLWGYQYEPVVMEMNRFNMSSPFPSQPQSGMGWSDATITVAEGKVLLTPTESNKLFCLDLLTGKPLWPPRLRQGELTDSLFVAAVHDGRAILAGKHRVFSLSLGDGKAAWKSQIRLDEGRGEMPSGRGFLHDRFYYLPTTTGSLLKIDLALGKIAERVDTGQVLGNLVAYEGEILSQNSDYVSTFYQIEPLRNLVAERLQKEPDDAWALARRGELLIHDGNLKDALQSLRRAYQLDSSDEAVRAMLVDTLLGALRDDFSAHQSLASELERLIERPVQRQEYLRLMASGLHQTGQLDAALDAYLNLTRLLMEDESRVSVGTLPKVRIDEQSTARLDRWLYGRLSELFAEGPQELQQRMDQTIQGIWKEVSQHPEPRRDQFLALFGFHKASVGPRLELAQTQIAEERWLDAQRNLRDLAQLDPSAAIELAFTLGMQLNDQSKFLAAGSFHDLLQREWPEVESSDGRRGKDLAQEGVQDNPLRDVERVYPYGKTVTNTSGGPSDNEYRRIYPLPLRQLTGRGDERLTISFDAGGASAIMVRKGSGELLIRVPLDDSRGYFPFRTGVNYAYIHGELLVAVMADQVVAIDMLRAQRGDSDPVLWRDTLSQGVPSFSIQNDGLVTWSRTNPLDPESGSVVFVKDSSGMPVGSVGPITDRGIMVLKSRTLYCLDPLTGEVCWTRENIPRGSDVFGDADRVFLSARSDRSATVLSSEDGRMIGKRDVPDWDHRWWHVGDHILSWQAQPDGIVLRCRDAWAEQDVWIESLPRGARGTLVGDQAVAWMLPDGSFRMRSLVSDRVIIEHQLEPQPELNKIYVLPSESDYIVAVSGPLRDEEDEDSISISPVGGGMPAPLIRGEVYRFDRNGKPLWQVPASIDRYGLPLDQPADAPTLWFLSQRSTNESRRAPSQSDRTSVLCLDRRSGRIVTVLAEVRTRATAFDIVTNLPNQSVQLRLPGNTVTVRFTDEVIPPEPPAQTGPESSLDEVAVLDPGSVLGSLQRILQERLPKLPQP